MHDSYVVIPLTEPTSKEVTYSYNPMDAAYEDNRIEVSRAFGHAAVIDENKCRNEASPMDPHEADCEGIRSRLERANSRLKDDSCTINMMVKGHARASLHLFFGAIISFLDQLLRLLV